MGDYELPVLDIDKNEGYPSFLSLPDLASLLVQQPPYPKMAPVSDVLYNEGYPSFNYLPDLSDLPVQQPPYPKMVSRIIDLDNEGYPALSTGQSFGAYAYTSNLVSIQIPVSVKYISNYAFYDSAISSVKLSRDCIFYEKSFPNNCEIIYYD